MIRRLAFSHLRCFRDWQELTLGQWTLLYGANGSGKSAAARLLPWLASHPRAAGPDLSFAGLSGASPRDLTWSGPSGDEDQLPDFVPVDRQPPGSRYSRFGGPLGFAST